MKRKKPSVTVGIPTFESSESLVATIKSIYDQTAFRDIAMILIIVDGKKMHEKIKKAISHPKVTIVQKRKQMGQSKRLEDIFRLTTSDLLIITNDDVVLERNAVSSFIRKYQDGRSDFFSGAAVPYRGNSLLRKSLAVSYELNAVLISLLRSNTYLSTNGRLIALTKRMYMTVKIPHTLQNNDAYLYFFARSKGFRHSHVPSARVYFNSPAAVSEHLKQSRKFQISQLENMQYFGENISTQYIIPKSKMLAAVWIVFLQQPIFTACYMFLYLLSRIRLKKEVPRSGIWATDYTTKVA